MVLQVAVEAIVIKGEMLLGFTVKLRLMLLYQAVIEIRCGTEQQHSKHRQHGVKSQFRRDICLHQLAVGSVIVVAQKSCG